MAFDFREYIKEYNRKRYDYRKQNGLCVRCGAESDGAATCKSCMQRLKDNSRKLYRQRKEAGLCVNCGANVDDGRVKCMTCRVRQKQDDAWRWKKSCLLRRLQLNNEAD